MKSISHTRRNAIFLIVCATLSPGAAARTLSTLWDFGGNARLPQGPLLMGENGVLYGTTANGGPLDAGSVFELVPPLQPGGPWAQHLIHQFSTVDGANPCSGVIMGPNRVLYGTAANGGSAGSGVVFQLVPPRRPADPWTLSVLYSFRNLPDGAGPFGSLTMGPKGVLFGSTIYGGTAGKGTVFQLVPPSEPTGLWTETTLYRFLGEPDGSAPSHLVLSANGALYGTTNTGGKYGFGSVFQLMPQAPGDDAWKESILWSFTGGADGSLPQSGLIPGTSGTLIGATAGGGAFNAGAIFQLIPPHVNGSPWSETVLYSFSGIDGAYPENDLVLDGERLYGTTESGGLASLGTLFELVRPQIPGEPWTERTLHSFRGSDGSNPASSPVVGPYGAIYGTTMRGGPGNAGTAFELTL